MFLAVKKAKFGQHIELATPSSITLFAKCLYIVQITYAPGIAAMKLSVLLFYHRLFAIPPVKMSLIVLGAITIAWLITMVRFIAFSFQQSSNNCSNAGIYGDFLLHTN